MKKLVIRPSKTIREKVYEYLREEILNANIRSEVLKALLTGKERWQR
jgi:hypothetical protein